MNRSLFPVSAMTVAITLALAPAAQATTTAAPVVVTATRFQTTIDSAPVNSTIITAEQIKNSNVTTLSQLLEQQGGVYISDLYGITDSKSSADMGGFGATAIQNTLILLNGRRLNDPDLSGANLATVPLASIERVEIIHGSSTVLYGDNATSGAINIVTKNGFEQPRTRVSAEVGSFSTRRLDLSHSQPLASSALYVAASALRSDGYRDNNDFDQQNVVAELNHNDEEFSYGFRFNGAYEDMTTPGALAESIYENNPKASTTRSWAKQNRSSLDAYIASDHYANEFTVTDKHQEFPGYQIDVSSWSITPRLKRNIENHDLIAGLDIYYSALDTSSPSSANHTSYALYLTDNYTLGSASSLSLGLRRQWADVEIENFGAVDQRDDAVTAWEIGLNHQFNSAMRGYLRWADSFRFAVPDEMWDYTTGAISSIKPQTAHHIEAGSALALSEKTGLDINLFRITLTNEIGYDSNTFANINFADPTRHQGANLNLRHQINAIWQANLGYGWRDATFTAGANEGKAIPEIPKHKLTLANTVKLSDHDRINVDAVYTGERYFGNDFTNAGKQMPSQTLVNLGYNYTVKSWTTTLRINNITDKQTADSGYYTTPNYSYYPLPGRAYYLNVGKEF
jgi:iron complex outermembrane receptor protein